jgi:hypothetical protein
MKKIVIVALVLFVGAFQLNAQSLKYSDLVTSKRPKGKFESYESSDGGIYKVGEKIKIGVPSSNKTFAFITEGDGILTPLSPATVSISGNEAEIKSIMVGGNKRAGFSVFFRCKGMVGLGDGLTIEIEDAIKHGEVLSLGMTSDEALSELKKAKDKLDLGLITEEEYEKIKSELIKYIN